MFVITQKGCQIIIDNKSLKGPRASRFQLFLHEFDKHRTKSGLIVIVSICFTVKMISYPKVDINPAYVFIYSSGVSAHILQL